MTWENQLTERRRSCDSHCQDCEYSWGLTSDEYGRFGASVVDLGNNFATTERDIVEMTNRLAAGGKLAGLTAPDILGLATAMSSVGD